MTSSQDRYILEGLIRIGAIHLSSTFSFCWTSGIQSPIYCDNRKSLSEPILRNYIKQALCSLIKQEYKHVSLIAGVATAGIPWGMLIADTLSLPFVYVRTKSKEHGLENLIEGTYSSNDRCIVVEDLISTGKSSLHAVKELQKKKVKVLGVTSIFNYQFGIAEEENNKLGVHTSSVCYYHQLISLAMEKKILPIDMTPQLERWHKEVIDKWKK